MTAGRRTRSFATLLSLASLAGVIAAVPTASKAQVGGWQAPRMIPRPASISIPEILSRPTPSVDHKKMNHAFEMLESLETGSVRKPAKLPFAALGGASAPGSAVVKPSSSARGFLGLDLVTQETAGTGDYSGTGGGLEPPDQAICVGNGYVLEGVNQAFQVFSTSGKAMTKPILLAQFFNQLPNKTAGPTSFLSDPKCMYDPAAKRFFATTLEIDEASTGVFTRAHNVIAVSKTSDPTKSWWVYSFDVTDDGLMGTPFHPTCPCLGDQPLIGFDKYGFYMSTNEYSDAEVFPVAPPPAVFPIINKLFTLPGFRNGQAQVYALSKLALLQGKSGPIVQYDTADQPLPSDAPSGSVWSSLQPSFSPPHDQTSVPSSGAEFFMSQLDFATTGDNRVAVWALTNTKSLNGGTPHLGFQHTIIRTLNAKDTYTYAKSADQKAGPTPLGDQCIPSGCEEEQLNGNDDRMNQVMLTNGHLWSAVNTLLPPIIEGDANFGRPRTGIMYFDVVPSLSGGKLGAKMARDGYVSVPKNNVLFPSIGASPLGPVVMSFTLSGISYYPSAAWARLDGLAKGQAPTVHISGPGVQPEDGFTGYCLQGIVSNIGGQCSDNRARWGDYSASAVDEYGCVWSGTEYISGIHRDEFAGNWSTFVTKVAVPGCTPAPVRLAAKVCPGVITDPAGDDKYIAVSGANPQMDIVKAQLSLSPDAKYLVTTLTIANLSTAPATPGGTGNDYYVEWTYNNVVWFSHAVVDPLGDVTYTDGQIVKSGPSGTYTDRTNGTGPTATLATDAGTFKPGKNGTITIKVPLSAIGSVRAGTLLKQPMAETREEAGILLELIDDTAPAANYALGAHC